MRNLILVLLLLTISLYSFSKCISFEQAKTVAKNLYFERANISKVLNANEIRVNSIRKAGESDFGYYICNMSPKGYVVVSADDRIIPILAYSFESSYADETSLPEGFKVWMDHYSREIEFAVHNSVKASNKITIEWQRLLSSEFQADSQLHLLQSVEPLLVSKWNQGTPYNDWCPLDPAGPGGRCYAGCVATAMGQLLYYYRFPQQGQGSYSYIHPTYGNISANFDTAVYKWNNMPSSIVKETDAISELLLHQGVSVDMDYGPDGSGMWNHKAAYSLNTYFRYGPETQYYFRDSVTLDWDSLIVANLDQRKPLYYAGWAGVQSTSGHAFVCDGYQPGNYYHFNWGWGGSQDGYFYTDNLTPGGNNFNFAQEIIPLFPDTLQNTYPQGCQSLTSITELRGSVEDGSGWYNYLNNSSCSWLIDPQNEVNDSINSIKITFLRFDIESGADSLFLYDGADATAPLLGAYSGNALPDQIISNGNKVFIVFQTNSSNTKPGWQLDFECNFPVYCSGITTLTTPSGYLEDGSSTKKYNNNSMCRWKITPAGGMPVTFVFTSFETHDSSDIVKVIDLQTQEILGTFSGNSLPPSVTAGSGKMMILFTSNSVGNDQGWTGEYFTSGVGTQLIDSCVSTDEIVVFPNPTNGKATLQIFSSTNSEGSVIIADMNGNIIFNKLIHVTIGVNKIPVDISTCPKSAYMLILNDGTQKEFRKLLVHE